MLATLLSLSILHHRSVLFMAPIHTQYISPYNALQVTIDTQHLVGYMTVIMMSKQSAYNIVHFVQLYNTIKYKF